MFCKTHWLIWLHLRTIKSTWNFAYSERNIRLQKHLSKNKTNGCEIKFKQKQIWQEKYWRVSTSSRRYNLTFICGNINASNRSGSAYKKEDIEIANERKLKRYIKNTYEARTDDEEDGDSKKAYIIQVLKDINVVNASITDERETTTKSQNEDGNKAEDPTAKTNVADAE